MLPEGLRDTCPMPRSPLGNMTYESLVYAVVCKSDARVETAACGISGPFSRASALLHEQRYAAANLPERTWAQSLCRIAHMNVP